MYYSKTFQHLAQKDICFQLYQNLYETPLLYHDHTIEVQITHHNKEHDSKEHLYANTKIITVLTY